MVTKMAGATLLPPENVLRDGRVGTVDQRSGSTFRNMCFYLPLTGLSWMLLDSTVKVGQCRKCASRGAPPLRPRQPISATAG